MEEILAKAPVDRTQDEIELLDSKFDELTPEQKAQLAGEKQEPQIKKHIVKDDWGGDVEIVMGETKIVKTFATETKALGDGEVVAVVASDSLDRYGEVLDLKGLDTKNYMKNPVVAWGHDYSSPAIGKTISLEKKDGKLVAHMKFAINESEKAREIYSLIKGGFLNAFSIGFIPLDMNGNRYTKSEMLEFSSVLIPANAEALVLAKSKGLDSDIVGGYNLIMKYELSKVTEKSIEDLTRGEVKFLQENVANLSDEQKANYKEILETKDVVSEVTEAVNKRLNELEKKLDAPEVKDINMKENPNKDIQVQEKELSKEEKFKLWAVCLQRKNFSEYNAKVKGAMDTTDTSEVVPPTEFIAEVERLEEEYGVARQFAKVRRSTKSSITMLMGDDDLEVFDTEEGGVKTSTKLTYAQKVLSWRKFAGILPITDELNEESAVNLWDDATKRFARAFARQEDLMVFTRANGGGNLYPGVLNETGVNEVVVSGDSFEDISFDDLNEAIYGVPTPSMNRGRFFLHRELLGVIQRIKNTTTGEYVWKPSPATGAEPTIWGKPYTLVDVLPSLTDDDEDTPFMIFGDLSYVTLGMRTDLQIKVFDSGTVGDPEEDDQDANTLNLLTQDLQAMRAVKRMNSRVRFPSAFSVIKTGVSGS